MICKCNLITSDYYQQIFNYKFKGKDIVELDNVESKFEIPYKEWYKDYYIIDKWRTVEHFHE